MALFKRKKDTELLPELPGDDGLPSLPEIGERPGVPELPPLESSISEYPGNQDQKTENQDSYSGLTSYPPLRKPLGSGPSDIKRILSSNEVQKSPYGISTSRALNEPTKSTMEETVEPFMAEPAELVEEELKPSSYKRSRPSSSEKEAIYIRLDKFQITKQILEDIKEK